jgi:hypothetical protein
MFSIRRIPTYLKRVLSTLGITIAVIVLLGLPLARWLGGGLADNPLPHTLLIVVSMLPFLLALVAIPLIASRFLRTLYDIKSSENAYYFLNRMVFGSWEFGPYLLVKDGEIARGQDSVLHRTGGPGFLVIYNNNAVVTERCGRLGRVLGPGFAFLERFEKVWEIVDLRPQQWSFTVRGMTREGIPVSCVADVRFKIDDQGKQPTEEKPYTYTNDMVFRAATSRWIRDPDFTGQPMDWAGRLMIGFTEGTLRNLLAEYRLDWLLGPTGSDTQHPREVIRQRLEEQLREKALTVGARTISVDLGEIQPDEKKIPRQWIDRSWIEAWQAEWESRSRAIRAEGEAKLLRMDVAQAQAQAEMIITLTQALQSVALDEEELQPYLLATRFVQALRWLSYDPLTRARMPPEAIQTLGWIQNLLKAGNLLPEKVEEEQPREGT